MVFFKESTADLLFLTAIDYRSFGFFGGALTVLIFFPAIYLTLKGMKLDDSFFSDTLTIQFTTIFPLLLPIPISIGLIVLNYLELIKTHTVAAAVGPFFFVINFACIISFLRNWSNLSGGIRFLAAMEALAYLIFVLIMFYNIEFQTGRPFDFGYAVGSWINVIVH